MDGQLFNILLLSTAFMVLFTPYQTTSLLAQSVLEGVKNETVNGTRFQGSGYLSQGIMYLCYTIINIFVPAIISKIGPAVSMFVGAIAYFLYVIAYIYPMTWSFYVTSILIGFGASTIWMAQGVYLSLNSNDLTITRNTGIFWALVQFSQLPGNIYAYLFLKTDIIHHSIRYSMFSILSVVAAIGLVLFICIIFRSYMEQRRDGLIKGDKEKKDTLAGISSTLKEAGRLLKTRNMLILLCLAIYLGLSSIFLGIVYGTCIGHYKKYGDTRKRLIGLHGIIIGLSEALGSGLFGFVTKPRTSSQRAFVILISFFLQIIFYYLVFINIPFDASANETDTKPYIDFNSTTSLVITFIGSFIAAVGDSGFNTQTLTLLCGRYKETCASAFAIFKVVQALAAAAAFFCAASIGIQWQLLILIAFLFTGTLVFFAVLFDDTTNGTSESVIIPESENENVNYQYSETS